MRFTFLLILMYAGAALAQTTRPADHPSMPSLPAGHPALPAGHPDISSMSPSTQPSTHASIVIRVIQGTKDAPAIKGEPIVVELYHQNKVIRKVDAKLDNSGIAMLEGLPLLLEFQPVVHIVHGGAEYSVAGEWMTNTHPDQQIDLTVYENTDQAPAWQVHMLHILATPAPEGLRVMQMLAIENPTDRTWVGKADAKGRHVTLSLPIPPGAKEVVVGGFLQEGSALTDDWKVISTEPLQPGPAQAQINYLIPGKQGQASLKVTTPTAVKNMLLFLPDDGTPAKVEGLESAGVRDSGDAKSRMFRGAELKAGHEVAVNVTLPEAPAAPPAAAASTAPKVIAGVGAAVILALGAFIVVLKTPKAKQTK